MVTFFSMPERPFPQVFAILFVDQFFHSVKIIGVHNQNKSL